MKMIAHRGASRLAPENTIPAYELAGRYGYFGFECDIHETKDGEFVLMHDETVDRTTDGKGRVADLTLAQIKALRIRSEAYPDLQVPTLREFLQVCRRQGAVAVVEIKKTAPKKLPALLAILKEGSNLRDILVISFHKESLIGLRELEPRLALQWIAPLTGRNLEVCREFGMGIDSELRLVTERGVQRAGELGVEVNSWTVNEGVDLQDFVSWGVDYVTTDCLMWRQQPRGYAGVEVFEPRVRETFFKLVNPELEEASGPSVAKGQWYFRLDGGMEFYLGHHTDLFSLSLGDVPLGSVVEIQFEYWLLGTQPLAVDVEAQGRNWQSGICLPGEGWQVFYLQFVAHQGAAPTLTCSTQWGNLRGALKDLKVTLTRF